MKSLKLFDFTDALAVECAGLSTGSAILAKYPKGAKS